jgi:hypothetical protein
MRRLRLRLGAMLHAGAAMLVASPRSLSEHGVLLSRERYYLIYGGSIWMTGREYRSISAAA